MYNLLFGIGSVCWYWSGVWWCLVGWFVIGKDFYNMCDIVMFWGNCFCELCFYFKNLLLLKWLLVFVG